MPFTLDQLIRSVNTVTEESNSVSDLVDYFNDAIAQINVEAGANYPFYDGTVTSYVHPLPDNWKRLLLIPFVVGRVKQQDSSQFEYTDSYSQFVDNLNAFITRYTLPDAYKATDQSTVNDLDVNESPWAWGAPFTSKGPLDE